MRSTSLLPLAALLSISATVTLVEPTRAQTSPQITPGEAVRMAADRFQAANNALEQGDTAAFVSAMEEAESLRPGHQTLILQAAYANAVSGDIDGALDYLESYAIHGFVSSTDLSSIPPFGLVLEQARWDRIAERIERNRGEVGSATEAFRIDTRDFVPEGLAYDPETGHTYLGSVHRGEIVRIRDGRVEDFAGPDDGLWSAMGMRVDAERRHLWVATTAAPNFGGYDATDEGRSAVLRFDLGRPGSAPARFETTEEGPHWFGDLVVAVDGTVYVSDSQGNAVYVLRPGTETLDILVKSADFPSPQGLDLAADGTLYLADYSTGIYAIDTDAGTHHRLEAPAGVSLLGIDGLYVHDRAIIAIHNGINPHRIVRLPLSGDGMAIESAEILEMNRPFFAEPTLGMVVGDELYFVANSQWFLFDEDGKLPPASEMQPPLIVKRSLR